MQFLRNLSIKKRLVLITAACSALALAICSVGFIVINVSTAQSNKVELLESQAQMLAFNSTAVLTFQDAASAEELLRSLRLQPSVEYGCLYDRDGTILASYVQPSAEGFIAPQDHAPGHWITEDGRLHLSVDVVDGEERVGSVFLRANMQDVHEKFLSYLRLVSLVAFGALAVSLAASLMLQRTISKPLGDLASAARKISSTDDYSIRVATRATNDELGELCEAFNRMLDQVEASRNALKGAVANMSHEIRTPINAVLGFTELLRQGTVHDESERAEYLDTIHTSGQHLLSLINDILDLSKIEAGQIEIDCLPCSPHQVIAEVVSVLRVRAREKGISLEYEWSGKVPSRISTDADRLRQLLINLVGNAVKFTQMGGVRVVAMVVDPRAAQPQLQVEIIDSGIGIPEEKLAHIFEPFVQADHSVTRTFGGTGLGLAISRQIARALGGDVRVRSQEGVGTTFTVLVNTGPLDDVPLLDSPVRDVGTHKNDSQETLLPTSLAPARILIVDDGLTNRKLIQVILKRAGARVSLAENGQIGFEMAVRQSFHLILMDMQMPVMDGYTATRKLRDYGLDLPIIALTAHAMKGDEAKCRAAGCSGYLTKPIDAAELLATVAQSLQGQLEDGIEEENEAGDQQPPAITASESPILSTLPTDDPEFREIVEEFIEKFQTELAVMKDRYHARDFTELARRAHWLKGSGGTAGFAALTDHARQLEQEASQRQVEAVERRLRLLAGLADRIAILPQPVCSA